jgi:hypothetical protein
VGILRWKLLVVTVLPVVYALALEVMGYDVRRRFKAMQRNPG